MNRQLAVTALACLVALAACERRGHRHNAAPAPPEAFDENDVGEAPASDEVDASPMPPEPTCRPGQTGQIDGTCRPWILSRRVRDEISEHTATRLADGRVLVIGGQHRGARLGPTPIYDPVADTWDVTGYLIGPRRDHTATLLPDGRVLMAGGRTHGYSDVMGSAALFDPTTAEWSNAGYIPAGRSAPGRAGHAATPLADGRVLVNGGRTSGGRVTGSSAIFDPASGEWSDAAEMAFERQHHTLTTLPDGSVLAIGGSPTMHEDEHAHAPEAWASVERYDPATDRWSPAPTMRHERSGHSALALGDAGVLVVGGVWDPDVPAEWLPSGGDAWSEVGRLATGRNDSSLVELTGLDLPESVLVLGGYTPGRDVLGQVDRWPDEPTDAIDVGPSEFRPVGVLSTARGRHRAVVLDEQPNEWLVLLIGGRWSGPDGATSLLRVRVAADGDVGIAELGPAGLAQAAWPGEAEATQPSRLTSPRAVLSRADDGEPAVAVLSGGEATDVVWRFLPASNEWTRLPHLPRPVRGAALGWLEDAGRDGAFVVAGGEVPVAASLVGEIAFEPTDQAWLLDLASSERWEPLPGLSSPLVRAHAVARPEGLVVNGEGEADSVELVAGTLTWRGLEAWPTGLTEPTLQVTNESTVVGCGQLPGSAGSTCHSLEGGATAWTPLPELRLPRTSFTTTLTTSGLLAIGGQTSEDEPTRAVEILTGEGVWQTRGSLPQDRTDHAALLTGDGRIIVIGGRSKTAPLATTLVWTEGEGTWTPGPRLSTPRFGHVALTDAAGRILIVGGEGDDVVPIEILDVGER